jgi:hypothetical protein
VFRVDCCQLGGSYSELPFNACAAHYRYLSGPGGEVSNSYNALEYLATIVFAGKPEGKRMIFVAPYIESGTHENASMLVLAGYLATVDRWAAFTDEWNKILDDLQQWQSIKKDHYYFHMQKFGGNWKPYEKFAGYPDDIVYTLHFPAARLLR